MPHHTVPRHLGIAWIKPQLNIFHKLAPSAATPSSRRQAGNSMVNGHCASKQCPRLNCHIKLKFSLILNFKFFFVIVLFLFGGGAGVSWSWYPASRRHLFLVGVFQVKTRNLQNIICYFVWPRFKLYICVVVIVVCFRLFGDGCARLCLGIGWNQPPPPPPPSSPM